MPDKITVLVVEDEALLRMDTVQELVDFGFDVMEAANAREAINIFMNGTDSNACLPTWTCQATRTDWS